MANISVPYRQAHSLLKEGDVLLCKGTKWYSRPVSIFTRSYYTHVGIVSRHNGFWEVIEFSSNGGGAVRNVARVAQQESNNIDVYRPISHAEILEYNACTQNIVVINHNFDGKAITNTMRQLTGLPYGWRRIWWIFKHKLFTWRLLHPNCLDQEMDDDIKDIVYPICSSVVAYAFSSNNFDLIKNKSDEYATPGDIAMSARLNKLFSIKWTDEDLTYCKANGIL